MSTGNVTTEPTERDNEPDGKIVDDKDASGHLEDLPQVIEKMYDSSSPVSKLLPLDFDIGNGCVIIGGPNVPSLFVAEFREATLVYSVTKVIWEGR